MNLNGQITHLRGHKAGLPKLTMQVKLKNSLGFSVAIMSATAEIRATRGPQIHGFTDSALFLGYGNVEVSPGQLAKDAEGTWTVGLPVPYPLLQKIEELRRGADLALLVTIRYAATITDQANPNRFIHTTVNSDSSSSAFCPYRVPKSDWIVVLKELGYGDYYLIEIPVRGVPHIGELRKALAHLEAGWNHFNDGADAETLASCYKSFERIALDFGASQPDQNGWDRVLAGIDAKKREKLKHLLHRLCDFMHLGRHEHRQTEWVNLDRSDAEFGLILSQATLAYLARLWSTRKPTSTRESGNPTVAKTPAPKPEKPLKTKKT